ncbi:hypothetical protein EVJ58_g4795 [Rhodofomes roseus]|uniref:Uncharacterized protein n=1 Tax=Rhodofomes roseus TaxID=34475 RepID=A0A4Y9YG49_9APHY|nr:hypothetical protein EVJ58_g4795 [Rhodofomes roseus]
MNQAQFEPILRKLSRDPKSVLAAARRRASAESVVIANSWEPQQGFITADDALDLFLSYLQERDVPENTNPRTIFCDAANFAFTGFLGISRLGLVLDEPGRLKRVADAWNAIFKWTVFIFSTRIEGVSKNDIRRKSTIDVLSAAWYALCSKDPIRGLMIATPMTIEIATKLWLEEDDGPPTHLNAPAGTCCLSSLLKMAKKEQLDRVLKMAGGKADEIAKLSLARVKTALKARPINGTHLTMHLDFINALSREASHPLRHALLGANVIWIVTNALTTISIQVNLSRDLSFLDAMVSAFGYIANCLDSTDGFTWVSQSIGAGLLTSFVDCSPHFSKLDPEDFDMILTIVNNILPRYTVYRSVLEAMNGPMLKIDKGPQRDRVLNSVVKDAWRTFFASSCDRMTLLHQAEVWKGKNITCDNVKECQAIAWKEGDHKNTCKLKQRERTEGKATGILKRDLAFFHNISIYDARKNISKLSRQADKEYPGKIKSHLVVCIDYCVVPTTYNLKPIEGYDTGPHSGSTNAQARNESMIEKVKDNPGKYTLIEARVANGQGMQCILTLATGKFWEWDPKEEQRQKLIDAQFILRSFVSRAEERRGVPNSERAPILTDPIQTDFPDDMLMALQELSDNEYEDDDEFD